MTFADAALPLALGIASSVHCAQMCGPIVIAYSLPMTSGRGSAHVAYNAGRIATYGLLGALAGLFGQAIALAGTARLLSILAGVAMIIAPFWIRSKPMLIQIGGSRVGRMLASPVAGWKLPLPLRSNAWLWTAAVLVVAFGILRNLPWSHWLGQ